MFKYLLTGLTVPFILLACNQQPETWNTLDNRQLSFTDIDATLERLVAANDVKGLGLALISEGQVKYLKGYGFRKVEERLAFEPETIIYGASLTKPTFAYLVMQLVDEGLIDLDKPIADYLPKPLPDYADYVDLKDEPRWHDLTMRILLSHTTGFANYRFFNRDGNIDWDGKLVFHYDPGSRYGYSGEGLRLAQFVLETGLGLDVGHEMNERIFKPFGMTKTSMIWRDDFLENYSHNYTLEGKNIRHEIRDKVGAAGSMDTTLKDWAAFLASATQGRGLNARSNVEMFKPSIRIRTKAQFPTLDDEITTKYDDIALSYGIGWGVFQSRFGPAFFKEGHDEGTANYALCIQPRKTCILIMSNSLRAEGIFKEIVDTLLGDTQLPWQWEGYTPYNVGVISKD